MRAACYDKDELINLAEKLKIDYKSEALKIYKELNDKEKYLALRLKNLEHGYDYYDLVQFYEENKEPHKAIKAAKEGLSKNDGWKNELLDYLAQKAFETNNRVEYLKLKYEICTNMLNLENYKIFENLCNEKEWQEYEPKLLEIVNKIYINDKIEIYIHRNEFEKAAELLPQSTNSAAAEKLKNKYPEKTLQFYLQNIGCLDSAKDRKIYKNQALIALKIKDLWINILKIPESWQKFKLKVKNQNNRRKAFQEEFKKVIPDW